MSECKEAFFGLRVGSVQSVFRAIGSPLLCSMSCDHRPLLKVIHFVVANDQTCGVSGRSIEDSVSLLRDVKHYASTGSLLDPIGLNPMDNRFGFEH